MVDIIQARANWKFGDIGFCGGRKTEEPGEQPSEQGENQQQTQPTYGAGKESNEPGTHWWETVAKIR